ncbi:galactose oxidase [Annulohypoxylon nitens]|nr:galactose oxidase [Annulohypoxylon nitens]
MKLLETLLVTSWATIAKASPAGPVDNKPSARWIDLPPVSSGAPVQEQGTAATDTHIYLLGGIPSNANNGWPAKSWKSLTPIPKAFTHINAAAVNGKIYVLRGLTGDGVDLVWRSAPDCFVYDPSNGTWTALPPTPDGQGRGASAVGVAGNAIYLAGGLERLELTINGTQESLNIVSAYDTEEGTWTTLPSLPAPLDHVGGAIIGRTFYVVGGRDHGQPNVRNTTWTLDLDAPSTGWVAKAEMPTARGGLSIGVIGDYIATFGGEGNPVPNSNGVFNETEVYDVKRDQWLKLPAMPHPRHGTVAASVHDRIYIPGGGISIGAGPVDTFDAFELKC